MNEFPHNFEEYLGSLKETQDTFRTFNALKKIRDASRLKVDTLHGDELALELALLHNIEILIRRHEESTFHFLKNSRP